METLERNIWQEVSSLLKSELENAIRNLANDLQETKDPEKRAKIAFIKKCLYKSMTINFLPLKLSYLKSLNNRLNYLSFSSISSFASLI